MSTTIDYASLFRVDGLVAVITGGGTGIGLYMARALAGAGAKAVYILGRREDKLQSAASTVSTGNIIPLVCDVTSQKSLEEAAARVRSEQGFVNVVIANAGISGFFSPSLISAMGGGERPTPEQFQKDFLENGMENFTKTLHLNTSGAYYTAVSLGIFSHEPLQPQIAEEYCGKGHY